MDIYVSSDIRMKLEEMPHDLISWLKGELTLSNPAFERAAKYGYNTHNIPEKIHLFEIRNGHLIIPRGMGKRLITYLQKHRIEYEFLDNRLLHKEIDYQSKIKLRDYQETAVNKMLEGTQGFLKSPCGSGKTIMMIEMMTRIKQPTLFIVHQKELMEQIITTAVNLTDITKEEIGIIGSGKRTVGERMTVATIQTLNRIDINEIRDKFGAIFIDEAHHLAAKSFYEVISQFRGCYRLAVSATPERADGLTQMVYACTGSIAHEIKQDHVPTIIPSLKIVKTNFRCASNEHSDVVKKLIADKERNELIIETIKSDVEGNYILVLSDRVEHLNKLKALITKDLPTLRIEMLTGSIPKGKRKEIMERAKNKEIDILLATQLAREGLDIPHLNRLFLTYPKKSAASVQQEVGRIMRPSDGKESAVVYDFYDSKQGILCYQFRKRKEVYEKIGVKGA
jgi:superfamily II DNA or RNA helicase